MQNDIDCPFHELRSAQKLGLIAQLLQIQEYRLDNEKCIDWYRGSTYLTSDYEVTDLKEVAGTPYQQTYNSQTMLKRTQCGDQAALKSALSVSYTWTTSKFEDLNSVDFHIFDRARSVSEKSKVRSSIITRVLRYVSSCELPGFWIDGDCINQEDTSEKQIAMQSMDLIYRFGDHPVAFLTSPIRTARDITLLAKLMSDKWIGQDGPISCIKLKRYVRVRNAQAMIRLLEHILSDRWWTRAWTYQEEYCASVKMHLLIPHYPHVVKSQKHPFGDVPGEVKVNAVSFREQVTRFCLAHMRKMGERWQEGSIRCKHLLRIAIQYRTIEAHTKASTPDYKMQALSWRIINDLSNRQISDAWDILAIIANCCGYSVRLDADKLQQAGYSLSTALLALVLLNGEILHNDIDPAWSADVNLSEVLTRLAFRGFESVVDVNEFTFLKRCRLVNVSLRPDGLLTYGCIWTLHERILSPITNGECPSEIQMGDTTLSRLETRQLKLLCKHLGPKYADLAAKIQHFMQEVQAGGGDSRLASMVLVARNLIRSIQSGENLAVGSIVGESRRYGIFVADRASKFCFTAWQARNTSTSLNADHYLEKIISLEVDLVKRKGPLKHIRTRRWTNGLCFFDVTKQLPVLLPWPTSFKAL